MPTNQPNNIKRTELVYNRYTEIIAPGETLEAVMNADKWVNVKRLLRVHDVIEIIASDGSFEADLRIVSINQLSGAIKFRVIRKVEGVASKPEPVAVTDRYVTQHAGQGKWRVIEKSTGNVVADGLDKADAEKQRMDAETSRMAA